MDAQVLSACTLVALLASLALTRFVTGVFRTLGHVAPSDPFHSEPIALSGGIAAWVAFLGIYLLFGPRPPEVIWLLGGSSAMVLIGVADDISPFRADAKLLLQSGIAAIMVAAGIHIRMFSIPVVDVGLTLLWVVGITNAFNLLDNMDGLAPGVAAIISTFLGAMAISRGDEIVALLSFCLAASSAGFLVYNFRPAKVFLGDAGSLFIGFTLAELSILGTWHQASSLALSLVPPVLLLLVPIFNTTFVTIFRMLFGVRILKGAADHINYRLLAHGLSHRHSVALVYVLTAVGGAVACLSPHVDLRLFTVLVMLTIVLFAVFGVFLSQGDVASNYAKFGIESRDRAMRALRRHRAVFIVLCDTVLVGLAYYTAYLFRFETQWPLAQQRLFSSTVLAFTVVKLLSLSLFGLHNSHWRYVTLIDVVALGKALGLAALVQSAVVVAFHLSFSRSVLVLDTVIALLLLGGVRVSFRVLREYFQRSRARAVAKRALIVGAGDAGELFFRELSNNPERNLVPIGFLDDDRAKLNARIHGVRVVGSTEQVAKAAQRYKAECVVIAMPSAPKDKRQSLIRLAREAGLLCYTYEVSSVLSIAGEDVQPIEVSSVAADSFSGLSQGVL